MTCDGQDLLLQSTYNIRPSEVLKEAIDGL